VGVRAAGNGPAPGGAPDLSEASMLDRRSPATFARAVAYQHADIPPGLTLEQWRQRKRAQRLCERRRGMVQRIWARKAGR